MNNEEVENKSAEQSESFESEKEIRSAHLDKIQEKMNNMDLEKRKSIFKRAVLIVFIFIVVKLCIGIACSRNKTADVVKETDNTVIVEDSLEQIANKILDYEFMPKDRKKDPEIEKVLDEIVKEDREEAERAKNEPERLKNSK